MPDLVRRGKTLLANADLIFALAGGAALAVLLLLDAVALIAIGPDSYAKGSVPVLIAIGVALLHERRGREQLAVKLDDLLDDVGTKLEGMHTSLCGVETGVAQTIDSLGSDFPFHDVDHHVTWDLRSPTEAVAKRTMQVRFNRRSLIITHRSKSDGEQLETNITVGPPDGYRAQLKRVEPPFLNSDAESEWIVPLDRPWQRGEVMIVEVERTLRDAFTSPLNEWVQLKLPYPTDRCSVDVVWPPGTPPTYLQMTRVCGPNEQTVVIPLDRLQDTGGRTMLADYEVEKPQRGELITLSWRWNLRQTPTQSVSANAAAAS